MIFLKKRIDVLVFERGFAESREKARAMILSGSVFVNGAKIEKPGVNISEDDMIEIRGEKLSYVSRGGLKLKKALDLFAVSVADFVCMDIGASTGGFTDCMLQNGAKKVYSVDVGHGQLDKKLCEDSRVINLEHTNARYLTRDMVPEQIDFVSVDVSFISLTLVLPGIRELLSEDCELICLIKPQFEAGKENIGKKGVVKDRKTHEEVINKILDFSLNNGYSVLGLTYSPIKGPEGNIEYLVYLKKTPSAVLYPNVSSARDIVLNAHKELSST